MPSAHDKNCPLGPAATSSNRFSSSHIEPSAMGLVVPNDLILSRSPQEGNFCCEQRVLPFWAQAKFSPKDIARYEAGEPAEYILGEVDFYDCRIGVDSRVLIPRPETEIMVDLIVKENPIGKVWDLCTGSGCIGIALKKALPHLDVAISDFSSDALEVARKNVVQNEVDVAIYFGDLLTPFIGKKANLIICNPPYISEEEFEGLDLSVKGFEPKMALIGKEGGLEFYRRLAWELPQFLEVGGKIFFEIGWNQGEKVKELFGSPNWTDQKLIQDFSKKDRIFTARFSGVYPSFLVS